MSVTKTFTAKFEQVFSVRGEKALSSLETRLQNLSRILKEFDNGSALSKITELTQALSQLASAQGVAASGKSGGSVGARMASGYAEATKVVNQYYTALLKLQTSKADVKLGANGVFSSETMPHYAEYLNNVASAYQRVTSAENMAKMSSEAQASFKKLLTQRELEYQAALEQRAAKERQSAAATKADAESTKNAADESARAEAIAKKQQAALTTNANLRARAASALKNWSAAQNSSNASSREAYAALKSSSDAANEAYHAYDGSAKAAENLTSANARLSAQLVQSGAIIKQNGDASQSLFSKLGAQFSKFSIYFGPMRIIMETVRMIREMIKASRELDLALGQMQIVTRESDQAIANFGKSAANTAKEIGVSMTDIIDSATTFARLGYNSEESGMLAKYTAMLKSVGDIEIGDAQDAMTSIIKAFDVPVEDIEGVMDKLVTVGNNFPISVSQIAEGMTNASSTLNAAGNSFEESVALLTAANTTIQNASKASTGLRTITARLRNTKTDLEELGEEMTESKYDAIVKSLADLKIGLVDVNGEYRSTYDVMADLAEKWDDLSSMRKAALATDLSGTRQQAVFYSIIDNFNEARDALEAMGGSDGALSSAYDTYLNTTEAHIGRLKATFQEFSADTLRSGFVNVLVDAARQVVNFVDAFSKVPGGLAVFIASITASVVVLKRAKAALNFQAETEILQANADRAVTSYLEQSASIESLTAQVANMTVQERELTRAKLERTLVENQLSVQEKEELVTRMAATGLLTEEQAILALHTAAISNLLMQKGILLGTEEGLTAAQMETVRTTIDEYFATTTLDKAKKDLILTNLGLAQSEGAVVTGAGKAAKGFSAMWGAMGFGGKAALVITAIMTVIGIVKTVVDNIGTAEERLKEATDKVDQISGEMNQATSKFKQTADSVGEIAPRLTELSKGVDQFGNNISLTEEQYKEFLELNNRLAEIFPDLKIGMDSNGNAMLNLSYNADTLTASLNELVKTERELANQKIVEKLPDLFESAIVETEKSGKATRLYEPILNVLEGAKAAVRENPDLLLSNGDYGLTARFRESGNTSWLDTYLSLYDEYSKAGKTLAALLSDDRFENLISAVRGDVERIREEDKSFSRALSTWLETDSSFQGLGSNYQDVLRRVVSDLDVRTLYRNGYNTSEKIQKYISDIFITPVTKLTEDQKGVLESAISDMYSIDTSSLSAKDYIDRIHKDIVTIAAKTGISYETLSETLGLEDIRKEFSGMRKELLETFGADVDFKDWIDSLSVDDLRKVSAYVREYGATSIRDLQEALKGGTIDALNFNLSIDEEEESIKTLNDALKESGEAAGLSSESIEMLRQRYAGLEAEGYRVDDVFRRTADGVRVNRDAVAALEREYANSKSAELTKKIAALKNEYNNLSEKIRNTTDEQKLLDYSSQQDDILEKIKETAILASNYAALTSAYSEWQAAKETPDSFDTYENIAKGYDEVGELMKRGIVNKDEVNAYLDLLLGEDRVKDNIDAWNSLAEEIGDTGYAITDFFKFDDDKNLTTEGLENFFHAVHDAFGEDGDKYVKILEDGSIEWDFTGQKIDEVAKKLGVSVELVQKFTEAMTDVTGVTSIGDALDDVFENLDVVIKDTYENFEDFKRDMFGKFGIQLDIETGDTRNLKNQLSNLGAILRDPENGFMKDGKIDLSVNGADRILKTMTFITERLRELRYGAEIRLSTEGFEDGQAKAKAVVDTINEGKDALSHYDMEVALGNTEEANENIVKIANNLKILDAETKKKLGLDTTEAQAAIDAITTTDLTVKGATIPESARNTIMGILANLTKDQYISIGVKPELITDPNGTGEGDSMDVHVNLDKSEFDEFYNWLNTTNNSSGFDANSFIHCDYSQVTAALGEVNSIPANKSVTVTVNTVETTTKASSGQGKSQGTAYASGDWGITGSGTALVGEVGPEIVVRNGSYFTVGENGAEMFHYRHGDIIFNAEQTRQILRNGRILNGKKRGVSYLEGTALAGGNSGSWNPNKKVNYTSLSGKSSSSSSSSSGSSSSSSSNYSSNSSSSSASDEAEDNIEAIDWIEIAISRLEAAIDSMARTASSAYKTLRQRLGATADEIDLVNQEIEIQEKAYDRYIKQANSVGLSSNLAKLVRDGAIDINDYDEDTRKLIDDYKEWYEKALDCADAIDELHENLADLYQDNFDNIEKDFDNRLSLLEHHTNTYEAYIEQMEASGYFVSSKYYRLMRMDARDSAAIMNAEAISLRSALEKALDSGEIEKYSEAWYDMKIKINEVEEAMAEAKTKAIEYGKEIRQISWDIFDFKRDNVSQLWQEGDFLIDLLEQAEMFTEAGKLTSEGLSTMGLHLINASAQMKEASSYAAELRDVMAQIEMDPKDTDAIERAKELVKQRQDAIKSAVDERDAVKSLVEEGIEKELDAVKKLIDAYTDELDRAKDLYDYQNDIADKTKDIVSLRKQLAAFSGDLSDESRARVQKLEVQLRDAEKDLREKEYSEYISDQKQILDDMYNEYERILNTRLDDVNALIRDVADAINSNAFEIGTIIDGVPIDSAAQSIVDTLRDIERTFGYNLSEAMRDVFADQNYNIVDPLDVGYLLTLLDKRIKNDPSFGDITGDDRITAADARLLAQAIVGDAVLTAEQLAKVDIDNDEKLTMSEARALLRWSSGLKDYDPGDTATYRAIEDIINGAKKTAGNPELERTEEANFAGYTAEFARQILRASAHLEELNDALKEYADMNGDNVITALDARLALRESAGLLRYANGGLVDFTGVAQLDGSKQHPELVLSPKDTENFLALRDGLRSIVNEQMRNPSLSYQAVSTSADIFRKMAERGGVQLGNSFGDINISIDHVENYDDFVTKLQADRNFERMIQSMTVDRVVGGSSLGKYKYQW